MNPIRIKRGLIIPRLPADDPDTKWHARGRVVAYILLCLLYLVLGIGVVQGKVRVLPREATFLGYFFLLGIPTIHYGIRPGKRIAWLITAILLPTLFVFPQLILIIPLVALFVSMKRSAS